jgi:hypothetical protein
MYSKFFKDTDVNELEQKLDDFLNTLDTVTGQITNLEVFKTNQEIVVLIIYNCWKKL